MPTKKKADAPLKKQKILKVEKTKPLTKKEQLRLISDNVNLSMPIIQEIFDEYEKLLFAELDRIQEFKFLDMGKIKIKKTSARTGRNPLTGEEVQIPAKTSLKFTFSKKYKEFASSLFE